MQNRNVTVVAVSKTKTVAEILLLYNLGQKDFGENYVQELTEKQQQLPKDIRWHFIGHLQSNKVKNLASFITLIHSIDSFKLLEEVNKQAAKVNRVIEVLLQVDIADEKTKFGWNVEELRGAFKNNLARHDFYSNIRISGLMGIASTTTDQSKLRKEFHYLKSLFDEFSQLSFNQGRMSILSMGMSSDYAVAVEEGSNMIRVGSLIFGERISV